MGHLAGEPPDGLRDQRGLVEATRILDVLDGLETPAARAGIHGTWEDERAARQFSEDRKRGLESLQAIVNPYLPGDLKFDHLAAGPERKKALARMAQYFARFTLP
jgi:hypothetical protein